MIRKVSTLLFLLGVIYQECSAQCNWSPTQVEGTHAPQQVCAGALIFEDNFDTFDQSIWAHEQYLGGGGNWELEWYTDDPLCSFAQDGSLHLAPVLVADENGEDFLYSGTIDLGDKCTNPDNNGCRRTGTGDIALNPIKSGKVNTANSFAFTYGTLEVRAKIPAGDWLWPAIWLLPKHWKYGGWPVSGEIDVMESRGNRDYVNNGQSYGPKLVGSTLHWGPDSGNNRFWKTHYEKNGNVGFNEDFHRYKVHWTPDAIEYFVDDEYIGGVYPPDGGFWELGEFGGMNNPWAGAGKMAPFDTEFYIILNTAIGGTFFPDSAQNPGGRPWSSNGPHATTEFWQGKNQWLPTWWNDGSTHMQVDYVRVWAI